MVLNSIIFSSGNTGVEILVVDFIALLLVSFLIGRKFNKKLTRNLYLWSNILATSFLMWDTSSPHYAFVIPVFILIASLILHMRSFLIISFYCVFGLVTFGLMKINNWGIASTTQPFGYWQMIDGIIILGATVYTAWQASIYLKVTLKSLNNEIQKVTDSRSEIETLVHFDPLTGLVNKHYCEKQYARFFETRASKQVTVFFLDLDNFKSINDFYDHSVGDKVLVTISQRLKGIINTNDIACRLSGDEFVLIIRRPELYDIQLFANQMLQLISKPIDINCNLIDITASIGIAKATKYDKQFNGIRKKADLAMYKAKQLGKNKFHIYNDEMYQQSLNKITIVNGLKDALKNNGLEVYIQPKIDISSGEIISAEALIRWTDKNNKNTGPAEFIPLIESTELICEIGEWVIHHACRLCKEWHDNGYTNLSIAVNISASQLLRGGLEKIIKKELKASQLPAEFLELELTEYAIFHDDDNILNQLKRLKSLGVILSIDDFGTGYSNLEYLTKFNVDILKIDQSFIRGIQNSAEQHAIVAAIIKMAKTLGLKIVAEGVETHEQLDTLKKLDCNYGQGFFWSEALPAKSFKSYLDESKINSIKPNADQFHQLSTV